MAEEDVLGDREVLGKGCLLGDHGDAVGKGVDWAAEGHARAPYGNDPLVGLKLPERMLSMVDLPEPFWPMRAWTTPVF